MINSATMPATRIDSISQPIRCVGVNVLSTNTDRLKPLIKAA